MHSALPSDVRRSTLRLAVAAVIVGLAIPLLPLFGEGGRLAFIFSQGLSGAIPDRLPRQMVGQRLGGDGRDLVLEARPGGSRGRRVPGSLGSLWPSGPPGMSSSRRLTSPDGRPT